MRDANPQTIYLKDYTVPEYLIHSVALNFDLDDENTRVSSRLTLSRNPASQSKDTALTLSGENMKLIRINLDDGTNPSGADLHLPEGLWAGQPRVNDLSKDQYLQTQDALIINQVPQQQRFVLTIENSINPKANTALEGLYLSSGMLCTQCEAEGFRKITYFLDRPDVMTLFTTTLVGDKDRYPVLLSNGNKVAQGELPDNRHWVTWEDPFNKPCYLFALVAGQLECVEDRFTTQSGRDIDLQIFVEKHDVDKCDHAMQSLKNAMLWDEQVYGREYDLDLYMIVAVSHFNMGAMENKGLNVFNTKFVLARPDTATDSDYEHIEGVIGHEYFHNWTGNRITCRDWFQLSLKEGFTVFRDQEFTGDRASKAVKRIEDVNMLRTRQFAEDAGPLAHPIRPDAYIEINNFYTLTVYEKGAEVVRMIHTLVGTDGFRKGSDLYFERHDGQAVTCDDFVNAMEAANNIDLSQFRRWYAQAGTPVLTVQQHYDPSAQTLTLTLSQNCPPTPGQALKEPLHIPVTVGLLNKDGSVAPCKLQAGGETSPKAPTVGSRPGRINPPLQSLLQLTQSEQVFTFENLVEQPVVSILRGFSAPVKLVMERSLDELAFLLSYDSDTFNRWEAGQQLAGQIISGLIADWQSGRDMHVSPIMVAAIQQVLEQPWDDLSYFSLLLSLPSETYLAEQMQVVDVEAIHAAREFVLLTLAEQLEAKFQALYRNNHRDESGQFDSGAIGRRRIKNTCLSYLSKLENKHIYQLSQQQFNQAKNMTDQMAALTVIVNNPHPAKQQCLDSFYHQWQAEALVIDKWFALQASSSMPEAFATVQALMQHPAFDLKNPNRVRSLIGAFSQSNPLHFHAANGQGYRFLADQIIALNTLNPQIASRMVGALTSWRRFDEGRQALIKTQLERIMTTEAISKDVYEVASKSLAQQA
ncbi:MAG: aminopeptidase N [Methylobacter sp.]|uniref:Aminopeptidase N n=1 Tax=Candidatus Methylobacter titanis TaxID=3053457 RepID=A0AA43TJ68_9GAMM|nr:aminopeptidase N [Candidatus Methylobacter titanis]MDI1291626.1 aminopeptidase N [Candidatus Methylobacter titanis]